MSTEEISDDFADLDLWPTDQAVLAMADGQIAAAEAVKARAREIAAAAEAAASRLRGSRGRLVYVGAGTSGRIGVQDGVELVPTYNWDRERLAFLIAGGMDALQASIEGAEDDEAAAQAAVRALAPSRDDVFIGIAASGRTTYTVAAIRAAAAAGALTIGFANNADAPLLEAAERSVLLDSGAEIVAGSTRMKAGTAQKIALNLFSTALMVRLGRIYKGLMVDMRVSNRKLRVRAISMVGEIAGVDPAKAEESLDEAGGDVKRASLIAMGTSADEAGKLLSDADGNLRAAIARLAPGQSSSSS